MLGTAVAAGALIGVAVAAGALTGVAVADATGRVGIWAIGTSAALLTMAAWLSINTQARPSLPGG
jgi:hypothetical protein